VFSFLGDIGGFIMAPLYYVTSFVLLGFHKVFGAVFGAGSGVAWVLSIIGLTLLIRAALIPLFVKQIKSSRNMQLLQPKVKELQKKYGHDRERLAQETMALYKETGTNPFASCLPILLQMPIFLALFRTLNNAAHNDPVGFLSHGQVATLKDSILFGIAKISDSFTHVTHDPQWTTKVVTGCLVVLMTATTFTTQRQLMVKNQPLGQSNPMMQQQKILLYVFPAMFAIFGINFPIGVLIYWLTTNLWTMGQQFYVIRRNPTPGSAAAEALEKRTADRQAAKVAADPQLAVEPPEPTTPAPVRQQPKREPRSKRTGPPKKTP
jgi:YidC/Oxa1 family membrane protein insertase